jgi:hypothetical protein
MAYILGEVNCFVWVGSVVSQGIKGFSCSDSLGVVGIVGSLEN